MDKKDILGMLGKIAAAAWLILFILAFSMDPSSRMGDVLILSAFAGVLPMIFSRLVISQMYFAKAKMII